MLRPSPKTTPDQWARTNRRYPPTSGFPGPRDPGFTPYMIPFARAVASRRHRKVVMVVSAQSGKTESFLDLIGHRLDQAPVPILYVGPSKQFITEQFEHRIMQLLDEAPTIRAKVARGKRMTKTRKVIAGVQLRLAHAGSSTALKSDPVGLALTDEADELMRNVRNQGDPIGLVDRRGDTYADFTHAIVSTPSRGIADVEIDEASGLEFWKAQDQADVESAIWTLWQQGTRYHWAWPCPHCFDYFIPRFSCLSWPKGATASEALTATHIACPRCGGLIGEDHKAEMNARGVYVAPGQSVTIDGIVEGDPPVAQIASFWVSGLCSPFKTFGERAAEFIEASESGDSARVQVVVNGGFGELWAPAGGDAPEWNEVAKLRLPYEPGDIPAGVVWLTAGVDVQKDRLVYVVRGWGPRQESWLIHEGEIYGETHEHDVWADLTQTMQAGFGGLPIRMAFIDSGFRPGKANAGEEHAIYEYCRRNARWTRATKGYSTRSLPVSDAEIDVTAKGGKAKFSLRLVRLDSDFCKSWVHERVRWPESKPGGWHLHSRVTDDYCRQIVSEARARSASGKVTWVRRGPDNHFLDAEALAFAAAYLMGVQRMPDAARRAEPRIVKPPEAQPSGSDTPAPPRPRPGGDWVGAGDNWV